MTTSKGTTAGENSHISIELLLGKPGSSSAEPEFGLFPVTFKKARAQKQTR